MSELDGFVVYVPTNKPVFLTILERSLGISSGAVEILGTPEHVNVFLDEIRGRVMIKRAEETYPNVMKLVKHAKGSNRVICNRPLTERVRAMLASGLRMEGHQAGEGTVIFEVKEGKCTEGQSK